MYATLEYQKIIYNIFQQSSPLIQSMLQAESVPEDYIFHMFPEVADSKRVVDELIAPAIKKLSDHYSQLSTEEQASIFPFDRFKEEKHSISQAKNSGDVILGYLCERKRMFKHSSLYGYCINFHLPDSEKEQHLKNVDDSAAKLHTAFSSSRDVLFSEKFTTITPKEKQYLTTYLNMFFTQIADTFNTMPYYEAGPKLDKKVKTLNREIKLIMELVKTANELTS